MQSPVYHALTSAAITLSLPWHSSAVEIADHNFNIVTGKLSKRMQQALAQAQPPRLAQVQLPQPQGTVPYLLVRQPPSDSLHDEDRVSMDFPGCKAL